MHNQKIKIKNQVYKYYFDNLVNAKKLETKIILIDEISCKDLVIYLTEYVYSFSIKFLSWYYHELTEKTKQQEEKNYLTIDDYMLHKVLGKISNSNWH